VVLQTAVIPVLNCCYAPVDGHEVPLAANRLFAADDPLSRLVLEPVLAGVASRRQLRIGESVGMTVAAAAKAQHRWSRRRADSRTDPRSAKEVLAWPAIKTLATTGSRLSTLADAYRCAANLAWMS
jgi:hypothetical protein